MNTQKTCSKCRRTLDISQFAKCKHHKDGLQYRCKSCLSETNKTHRTNNPTYSITYYQAKKDQMKHNMVQRYRELKSAEPWIIMHKSIKQRAKERKLDFNLDIDYIKSIWTDVCPVLGIPLKCAVFESGLTRETSRAKPMDNSPTLDRIDPTKGYIKGNVCIMSYRANMIKNCGTIEEHRKIVSFFENQTPN